MAGEYVLFLCRQNGTSVYSIFHTCSTLLSCLSYMPTYGLLQGGGTSKASYIRFFGLFLNTHVHKPFDTSKFLFGYS